MHELATVVYAVFNLQRDREDMVEFVRNTPTEFKEYYIQMQAAKRSQAPLPSEVIVTNFKTFNLCDMHIL